MWRNCPIYIDGGQGHGRWKERHMMDVAKAACNALEDSIGTVQYSAVQYSTEYRAAVHLLHLYGLVEHAYLSGLSIISIFRSQLHPLPV